MSFGVVQEEEMPVLLPVGVRGGVLGAVFRRLYVHHGATSMLVRLLGVPKV